MQKCKLGGVSESAGSVWREQRADYRSGGMQATDRGRRRAKAESRRGLERG